MKLFQFRREILVICAPLLLSVFILGCEGDQGPAGPPGVNPNSPPIITAVVAAPDSIGSGESTVIFVIANDPNGDPLSYSWRAANGQLAAGNSAVANWIAPRELGLYQVNVVVSDDDGVDSALVVIGVNVYVPSDFPSYLGDNENRCGHCHEATVESYHGTNHAGAWQTLVDDAVETNRYCIQCHVTGYDDIVDFGGNVTTHGQDNGGYDQNPSSALRNVQCEACHGAMGPSFASHNPEVQGALRGETCNRCHSQNEEYNTSGHGRSIETAGSHEEFLVEFNHAPCKDCHTSEGFIALNDPQWTGRTTDEAWQITCATCHDVHGKENDSYLRGLAAFPIVYGGPEFPDGLDIDNWGKGQLCGQCHHARRTESNVMGQINNGSQRPGPHESPQADMVAGYGSYEIPGYTYERESAHRPDVVIGESSLEDMCVKCHIYVIPFGEPDGPYHGHNFVPDVRACNSCHATPDNFDYHNKRTEIDGLMTTLYNMLPQNGTGGLMPYDTLNWTRPQREAGYAWFFVTNEKSHGVHNYTYAHSLLTNAIDYLTVSEAQACLPRRDD
jgi:hypothetical protein